MIYNFNVKQKTKIRVVLWTRVCLKNPFRREIFKFQAKDLKVEECYTNVT